MLPVVRPKLGQFYVESCLIEHGTVLCYQLLDRKWDSFMLTVVRPKMGQYHVTSCLTKPRARFGVAQFLLLVCFSRAQTGSI